ncbi:hypothetical protein [Bacillus weihaiensis]|uniref:hypothetical protein n=1 Tax=Bacillus weihaiensis TaxID=1547283 RepID=UPI002353C355|nr:hypothetical protein [Bacillus weihaiensis]
MTDVEYNLNKGISGSTISTSTEYIKVIEKNPQEENNIKASMQNSDSTINSNVQANVVEDTQTENNKKASISSDSTTNSKIEANVVEAEETQVEDDESTQIVSSEEMTKADYEKEVAAATKKLEAKAEGVTNSKISASRSTTSDSDSYNTSYKKVTTSVVKLSNGKYRVKNDVTWNIMPKNRDFDVIGVGVQPQWAGNKGSEYGKQTWKEYDYGTRKTKTGYSQYSTTRNPSYWNIDGNGFGVKMNLKNDNKVAKTGVGWVGTEVRNLNLYMYYTVGKDS